jgi:thiol:disulfide interchange protein/DsbC/DsbD-like thiol-disulfide interchange protein
MLLRTLFTAALLAAPVAHAALAGAVVTTDQVRAELVAHAPEGVAPGKPLQLGLAITHQPQWHTYWKNPGDSGLPTSLSWQLPAGATAGEIDWPTPHKLPVGPLMNYGYEGQLLLPVAVTVTGVEGDTLEVKLRADWLVCKDVCIPEGGDFVLKLPTRAATVGHAALFDAARTARPADLPGASATAEVAAQTLALRVSGLPAAWQGQALQWFPEVAGVIDNAARGEARWDGGAWVVQQPLSAQRSESPARMHAVLTAPGQPAGVRVGFAIAGAWPPLVAAPVTAVEAPTAAAPPPASAPAPAIGLGLAIVFALIGGALLNLMPCVFPVLSLKVLGFAAKQHDRRQLLAGGLAYTAGVVVSFVALAGLLIALRAGGEQLGWGFQLQSPGFVALLAALFTLIGLNLAGLFEFGSLLPSSVAVARAKHPLIDSALTGVLAVAVASPCTAPFMGASLGLAATLPAAQALTVFAALGLGMALPYLAASAWPALGDRLPRPGAWMARFKTFMAFPMFAAVVWLTWVLGQQVGIDGAAALLALLVALAFVAWAFGTPGFGRRARAGFGIASIALFGSTLAWAWPALREQPPAAVAVAADGWEPWNAARVAELLAEGRPVFVDFTAAWCVTCQLNKRTTLQSDKLRADFAAQRVALLRADWTRRDPAIAAALAQLGRNGVPVYALYKPGAAEPMLLPEILSVQSVRDALAAR